MSAPESIVRLVQTFEQHREQYRRSDFSEVSTRHQFIDPFFKALGWDVNNEEGNAEKYKEVVHEDKIKIGGATKAPDYSFRLGPARMFFVEAKKPSVDISHEVEPAYQLRRYAWSAKLPLSILTDFEEFAVYECLRKPEKHDKASTGRIMQLKFTQYIEKWDEIAAIFSKAAVKQGSLDRFAEQKAGKRGTAPVDDEFLLDIETWRELLARNLALRNLALKGREVNWAVQQIIDRIVFLRICEDRGLEPPGQLQGLLNGGQTYERLQQIFRQADMRYNSGLFHFEPEQGRAEGHDALTPALAVDDRTLKEIIARLYFPDSPYEFAYIPPDILGHVYERFLGKVIRLTPGRQVKIEEKPEVRKAGGVFYTPTYIVDAIVRETVGPLLAGKTPDQIAPKSQHPAPAGRERSGGTEIKHPERSGGGSFAATQSKEAAPALRILDPACGSGSFLLGAYQFLLDWHLDQYRAAPARWLKGKRPVIEPVASAGGGDYRLTVDERKRILMAHIFGVDIDPQAVEVTKLSLLLKVLEGEGMAAQLALFPDRVLPDLGRNIKCGNSLIGDDFYAGRLEGVDDDTFGRVNAFNWQEQFPGAMGAGGFDAVIGNPPYIRMETFKELKDYLKKNYQAHDERSDLYAYFVEKGCGLLREGGRFGMIVSNKFLRANYGAPLREFLSTRMSVKQVIDFAGLPVFAGATVRTIVLVAAKTDDRTGTVLYSPPLREDLWANVSARSLSVKDAIGAESFELPQSSLTSLSWTFARPGSGGLMTKVQSAFPQLLEYCDGKIGYGIKTGLEEAFVLNEAERAAIVAASPPAEAFIKPYINGRDIRRYYIDNKGNHLIYTYKGARITGATALERHLAPYKARLLKRATKQEWYELQQPQYAYVKYFEANKIVYPDIAPEPRFALDTTGYYGATTIFFIGCADKYLLGLLNSRFSRWFFSETCAALEGKRDKYLRFKRQYVEKFPIRPIDPTHPADRARHDRMVALVTQQLDLHARLAAEPLPHEQQALQRRIRATDQQIDALVYELYGLTGAEIAVVEGV